MGKKDNQKKTKPSSRRSDFHVEGNITESIVVIGDNNVIKYYSAIAKNTEKHEPDYWNLKHPYPMPPNFTGRVAERAMLTQWLNEDSENHLFILRALGGFGKSALTWHWLTHDVVPTEWPKVIFWSFYEGDASFENFITETLKYLKLEVPQGQRPQVDELLKAMQSQKILLIMDGFERALRAYSSMNAAYQGDEEPKFEDNQLDCVNINAEIFLKSVCSLPSVKSKVLMTTRLTPRAVKPRGEFMLGCREEELTAMQKEDAVEFFHKQKIKGTHAEIEAACAPYGYHPLSLRLLAGRILKDFDNPADVVVAQKFKIDGDLKQHQNHVLEVSYNSLPPQEQKIFNTIACFRLPVSYETLSALHEPQKTKGLFGIFKQTTNVLTESLEDELHDLAERGLLHFDDKKFDLHPIVRRYAYERLTVPDLTATHARLRDYFAAVDAPVRPQTLDDLAPIIELYHHMVRAGELYRALELFRDRLIDPLYYQMGAYQTVIELMRALFIDYEEKHPRLKNEAARVWAINALASSYSLTGQPHRAMMLFEMLNKLMEKKNDRKNLAVGLENIATMAQIYTGALRIAVSNIRRCIQLSIELKAEQADAYQDLGQLLAYCGMWNESEQVLSKGLKLANEERNIQIQGTIWALRVQRALLIFRDPAQSSIEDHKSAIEHAQRAIGLTEQFSKANFPMERNFVETHWLLGAAYRVNGQMEEAECHLSEALRRDHAINLVEFEADILLDLARLRYDQKKYEEAKSLAEEALSITERCGYVLQGADVNLFLAQYALEQEKDKAKAKEYAKTALKLATCDGPPYYYKVAYEEAERMLEKL